MHMDLRTLRLYHLAKQNLMTRAPARDYRRVLKDHLGLHSTDYLTPYLSLQARVEGFEPRELFDDLNKTRKAVRVRAFRGTIFVVHRDNLALIQAGAHHFAASTLAQILKLARREGQDFDALEKKVITLLAGRKCLTSFQLSKELKKDARSDLSPFFLRYLEFKGLLTRIGQKHLEDRVIVYGLFKDWLPDVAAENIDPDLGLETLVLRYVAKFGPVCLDDICWWLPVSKTAGKNIVERLKHKLAFFDLNGRAYMMEQGDYRKFQKFTPLPGGPFVTFLPYEDHFPKAYAVRDWFLSAQASSLLFRKGVTELGQIRPSIWLDGEAVGRWEMDAVKDRTSARVKVVGLVGRGRLSAATLASIERERRRVEEFINHKLRPLRSMEEEP